jgi:anti-sigma regulatory factor (Ser/Thr protein kinase)
MELVRETTTAARAEGVRVVRLRIPAAPAYVPLARLAAAGLAEARTLPPDTIADLKLALTEAVSAAVRRAAADGGIDVRYEIHADALVVEVADDGAGFDPDEPLVVDADGMSEHALGLAVLRAVADDVEIESRAGVPGARVRFVKKLC